MSFCIEHQDKTLRSMIAEVGPLFLAPEHGGDAKQNALLIAAAPEMLAELKHAAHALDWYAQAVRNVVAQEALTSVRAIIAKAEGRT